MFDFDADCMFKEAPENWIPADDIIGEDGKLVPQNGHLVGWVPLLGGAETKSYKWHMTAVNLEVRAVLLLLSTNFEFKGRIRTVPRPQSRALRSRMATASRI